MLSTPESKKMLCFRVPEAMKKRVERMSKLTGLSQTSIVIEAVDKYLVQMDKRELEKLEREKRLDALRTSSHNNL